ncbi:hypothetical protein EC973_009392 [Apophysomyces ossiformis]|uniref:Uncharacterized protein n=1 Tax=Apophysomyces ossiformis TaxID=679940 RepID=A0A8H7BLQ4_9FUNG|nr:hypothetical protein EC973_009392 [Apophysomyces ossiformis]
MFNGQLPHQKSNSPSRYTLPPIASSPHMFPPPQSMHHEAMQPRWSFTENVVDRLNAVHENSVPSLAAKQTMPNMPRIADSQAHTSTASYPHTPYYPYTTNKQGVDWRWPYPPEPSSSSAISPIFYDGMYYYPVYGEEWLEEKEKRTLEIERSSRLQDYNEQLQMIDHEFMDNREIVYSKKMKQLQEELQAVEEGHHIVFDECLADLDRERVEMIENAKLMMEYQLKQVDETYAKDTKKIEDDWQAEKHDMQVAMFSMLEEKRRQLKDDKDGELAHPTGRKQVT